MPAAEKRPPWLQVVEHYRAAIQRGDLHPGDELPSIGEVADEWAVGKTTAYRALTRLRRDGLIQSRAGKPSIVATQQSSSGGASPDHPDSGSRSAEHPAH